MGLDLLIRNGTVVDGSGTPRYRADIGVQGGRIVEIGRIRAAAQHTVDADGLIVAPGFIDGHTHMDAQVAWDPLGSCSCWHGVTSVVMGNCGFALAPCKPDDKEWFARCLTAVEDIPTEAMLAGIDWNWETFPEYLASVADLARARKQHPVDIIIDLALENEDRMFVHWTGSTAGSTPSASTSAPGRAAGGRQALRFQNFRCATCSMQALNTTPR
jgi:Amidohydrolase family